MAVLPMRLNGDALSDLVVLKGDLNPLTMALTVPVATFTVNSTLDFEDYDTNDDICSIGPINPGANTCTLRTAIEQTNASAGADAIGFTVTSISPGDTLPPITGPVTIDGTTAGRVELSESGLRITAGNSTVKGLVINRAGDSGGILLQTNGGNIIEGNFLGTDVTGTTAPSTRNNWHGVSIDSSNNMIGGTTSRARNLISGSLFSNIIIEGSNAIGNLVQGNFIGTDVTGTVPLGSSGGVFIQNGPSGNLIGGTTSGALNVIRGGVGIFYNATGNVVQGNFLGTDVTGTAPLGNGADVSITDASGNTIGGTAVGARNVIVGNRGWGVVIGGVGVPSIPGATGNVVQGNFLGTNVTGTAPLGNSADGVLIGVEASSNTIGGIASGAGNTIGFHSGRGVNVGFGTGNAILSNSIFSNTKLGIDLGSVGVTPNDAGDGDTGANNLQNFPVLTSASSTTVQGTLNSTPNTTFKIEFFSNTECDPSGFGEGKTFIGSTMVTTDNNGNATFPVPPGQFITATATDPNGNTSEFSRCIEVSAPKTLVCYGLGDSVAAGYGLDRQSGDCKRAPGAYPNRVALLLAADLDIPYDVVTPGPPIACSGAMSDALVGEVINQVQDVIDDLSIKRRNQPTDALVSITIGANDFGWTDLNALGQHLCSSAGEFLAWVNRVTSGVRVNVQNGIQRLINQEDVYVILTDYHNPYNTRSHILRGFLLQRGACQRLLSLEALYARTEFAVQALNAALRNAVASFGTDHVHGASVHQKFHGRESPRPRCGTAPPNQADTWVQFPLASPRRPFLKGNDCFHPNATGAKEFAKTVHEAARLLLIPPTP